MAKLSHLLLYDPDPSGLETLSYVFEKEGCKVVSTIDGGRLVEAVQSEGPPLVLVALREPEQAAIDLIREITVNPRTRNVACVAIGPARWRAAALQAGAFGLLASPVFLRDVLDASKLVAAATVQGSRPSPDTEVVIELSELGGVYYLIRALAASGRSAAVELSRGQRRGELRFLDGELSSVQIGALSGMPALHQALLWSEATLRLKFRNVVRRAGQLSLKNDELLEECDRFLRDFAHDVKDLGVAGTIYRPSDDARPTSSLPSEVVPLLRMFDGTRTLAQVLEESPFRVFDTLRIVHQFAAAEAIRADALPARKPVGMPSGPVALAAWFQHRPTQATSAPPPPSALPEEDRPTPPPEPIERGDLSGRGPRRPSAPFAPVESAAIDASGLPRAAKRTLTRRDYPIKTPSAPVPAPGAESQSSAGASKGTIELRPTPVAVVTVPDSIPDKIPAPTRDDDPMEATPPAVLNAAPISERPRAPSGAVARGEIQIAAPLPLSKKIEKTPKPNAPSVLVELGAVPQPRVAAPIVEAPLTAHQLEGGNSHPSSSGIPSPAPPAVKGPVVLRKKTPVAGSAEPNHRVRTPSSGFSAMESDFFEREADLYKRESVETFDDLEGGAGANRGSARKT